MLPTENSSTPLQIQCAKLLSQLGSTLKKFNILKKKFKRTENFENQFGGRGSQFCFTVTAKAM